MNTWSSRLWVGLALGFSLGFSLTCNSKTDRSRAGETDRSEQPSIAGRSDSRSDTAGGGSADRTGDRDRPRVCLAISVDWEGAFLDEEDLQAFHTFYKAHPDIPLTHLLNPGYYTKEGADADRITAAIRGVIREKDQIGVHVHAWESLALEAEVVPRFQPSFLDEEGMTIEDDGGFDVVLESYEVDEIRAILRTARHVLEAHGFKLSRSFRAPAWMAGKRVFEAMYKEGFRVDTSAVHADWLDELREKSFVRRVRGYWPDITRDSQPYWLDTGTGRVLEMPDTGALADYVTREEMVEHLLAAIAKTRNQPGAWRFVQLGFHQEGAAPFVGRVIEAVREVRSQHPDAIEFATLEQCAEAFKAHRETRGS